MREIRTSGSMSGEGKRSHATWPKPPRPSSTLLRRHLGCPESGHRLAAEGMPFPWRWDGGTISLNLDGIWGMSVKMLALLPDVRGAASES